MIEFACTYRKNVCCYYYVRTNTFIQAREQHHSIINKFAVRTTFICPIGNTSYLQEENLIKGVLVNINIISTIKLLVSERYNKKKVYKKDNFQFYL